MNVSRSKFRLALAATVLFSAALAPSAAFAMQEKESSSTGQAITDTAISTKLRAKLLADGRIKNSDVDVNTTNRVVTLTGKAATPDVRAAAESIAKQQEGVLSVDNRLVIASEPTLGQKAEHTADKVGTKVENAANSTGEAISDSYITSKIKSKLLAAKGLRSSGITVDTTDGVVTLSGHVPRRSQLEKAISIAKRTKGVKSVNSANLDVAASS
ncbi:MAG: hypothetical protein NVS9B10_20300 [Nevskia sp.]